MNAPALEAIDLTKTFGGGRTLFGAAKPAVRAVRGASFAARKGEVLGIVGESGCGKSTLARMLVGLLEPSSGVLELAGEQVSRGAIDPARFGRKIQYVFQDPISSLNPRKTIREILEVPLIHLLGMEEAARRARIDELFDLVGLRPEFLDRYPHEFSGGQAQRIGIARALAAEPEIMVLDEPVSALDVSVQAQVLQLLEDLKARFDLTYLFISHDLAVIEAIADRVMVMYFGKIVEQGPAARIFAAPRHPYTALLAASAPALGKPLKAGEGPAAELPDPLDPPPGCAFANRCPRARDLCREEDPEGDPACHFPLSG